MRYLLVKGVLLNVLWLITFNVFAVSAMKQDNHHIRVWNTFVEDVYQLHLSQIESLDIRTETEVGGYPSNRKFFKETRYFDSDSGNIISRIQREIKNESNIHLIEVYVYDKENKIKVDYLAAFLPRFRNAPVQTLINIHRYNDDLHAFRQFDASGARIYEQCEGALFDDSVFISLDEDELYNVHSLLTTGIENNQYVSCFEFIPKTAGKFLNPKNMTKQLETVVPEGEFNKELQALNMQLEEDESKGSVLIQRGDIFFKRHEFGKAIKDYTAAIALNDKLDEAYFGRGMALGREGLVKQGIDDLSVYLKRHPFNSRAYTKRGVRYIWLGNLAAAKKDLIEAVQIDIRNSEAHDDLGVVYASENNFSKATYHFKQSIYYDKGYQKAYHNLAMAYVVTENYSDALVQVDKGLRLESNNRNTLLLKSTILDKLGKLKQAKAIREHAEFLPEGNWSERFSLK